MEILSTGEKIKRARIYKGATLKDICEDKISVSKMSCIENDKVKAEPWILEFISKKLDIDIDYLKKDVRDQIKDNISVVKEQKFTTDIEDRLQYNLEYALEYNYYDLAFKILHILFSNYLMSKKFENIQVITSKYYDMCQKSNIEENNLIYSKDMARYFYMSKEYEQAASYYNNVRKVISNAEECDKETLAVVTYNEAACYLMLENYERAYEIAIRLLELIDYVKVDIKKAEMYHVLAILSLKIGKDNFEEYELKSYEYYKDDASYKSKAMLNYAILMFQGEMNDRAIEYVKKGLNNFPKQNKEELVEYMLRCVEELTTYVALSEAQKICDEALNSAICCDNIRYIEKAYYFKAIILQKQDMYLQSEMYMNLSLDALFKFGNKQERHKRYLEMGNMYHKLGETSEALKYFTLAMGIEKKI